MKSTQIVTSLNIYGFMISILLLHGIVSLMESLRLLNLIYYRLEKMFRCFHLLMGILVRIILPHDHLATLSFVKIYALSCKYLIMVKFGIVWVFFVLLFSMLLRFSIFLSIIVSLDVN